MGEQTKSTLYMLQSEACIVPQRVSGKPERHRSRSRRCPVFLFVACTLLPVPTSGQLRDNLTEECIGYSSCDDTCIAYYSCGGIMFEYPFWYRGPISYHKSFCGYRDFEIACQDATPTYRSRSGAKYIIQNQNKPLLFGSRETTLHLIDSQFVNTTCPKPSSANTTFEDDFHGGIEWFYPPSVVNLVFFVNCSANHSLPIPSQNRAACLQSTTGLTYVFKEDDPALKELQSKLPSLCLGGAVMSPVLDAAVAGRDLGKEFGQALGLGFELLLKWPSGKQDDACNRCEASGGWCAYANDTALGWTFRCHCSDGWHPTYCQRGLGTMLFMGLLCGFIYCQYYIFCKRPARLMANLEDQAILQMMEKFIETQGPLALKRYKYSELKSITESFTSKLGKGGFGIVYKGKLPDGKLVAVKVLNEFEGSGDDFLNEVATIGKTNHINVVSLLGFCLEGTKRALVYDFMANGSLDKFLFATKSATHILGWEQLYEIALGIAKGLEYLHKGCNTRIVHFDIKPHNILLDDDFCPKISDFGMAKSCAPKKSILSMAGTRGTIGYIAPEVFSRNFGPITSKSDVYSYGMMTLEIVGRRRYSDAIVDNQSDIDFPQWMYDRFVKDFDLRACGITADTEEIVKKMTLVGLWCIQTNPISRPSISKVVEMLEGSASEVPIPHTPCLCSPPRSEVNQVIPDLSTSTTSATSASN